MLETVGDYKTAKLKTPINSTIILKSFVGILLFKSYVYDKYQIEQK